MKHTRRTSYHAKTGLLLILFVTFATTLGFVIGKLFDAGVLGAWILFILSFLYIVWTYFMSLRTLLMLLNAHPITIETNAHLYKRVSELAALFHIASPELYYIPDEAINTITLGNAANRVLVITKGFMDKLTTSEVEAVLAHELAHIKSGDVQLVTLSVTVAAFFPLIAEVLTRKSPFLRPISFVFDLFSPISAFALQLIISPKREIEADSEAVYRTRYPEGLMQALHKSSQDPHSLRSAFPAIAHLFFTNPFKSHHVTRKLFFVTHPTIEERMQILREM